MKSPDELSAILRTIISGFESQFGIPFTHERFEQWVNEALELKAAKFFTVSLSLLDAKSLLELKRLSHRVFNDGSREATDPNREPVAAIQPPRRGRPPGAGKKAEGSNIPSVLSK